MESNQSSAIHLAKYFCKLEPTCTVRQELFELAQSVTDWEPEKKYTFLQTVIDITPFLADPAISYIDSLPKYAWRIFKLPPHTYYPFHVDAWRGAAFNLLLNEQIDSVTLFDAGPFRARQIHIVELKYEPNTFYLLNTKKRHAVLNKDSCDRFVLSVGVESYETTRLNCRLGL